MIAELFERGDMCANGNDLALDLHLRRAVFYLGAAGARRLKANKEDQILRIGQALRQVMLNAPAGGHAARRDNDAGEVIIVDLLRLLARLRERDTRPRGWAGA